MKLGACLTLKSSQSSQEDCVQHPQSTDWTNISLVAREFRLPGMWYFLRGSHGLKKSKASTSVVLFNSQSFTSGNLANDFQLHLGIRRTCCWQFYIVLFWPHKLNFETALEKNTDLQKIASTDPERVLSEHVKDEGKRRMLGSEHECWTRNLTLLSYGFIKLELNFGRLLWHSTSQYTLKFDCSCKLLSSLQANSYCLGNCTVKKN